MITEQTDWLNRAQIDIVISALTDTEYIRYGIVRHSVKGRKWVPLVIEDNRMENIYSHFDMVHLIIKKALSEGKRVLVHCAAGVSRSATLVAAYLIIERSIPVQEALSVILKKRECINPNVGFISQLKLLERMCYKRT
jgi:protein-tyrosine phosphatase